MRPPQIILGDVQALEDALAAGVAGVRRDDPLAPVTVLVGHVLLKPYLRRLLAARGVPLLDVRFVRPHELAASLAPAPERPALSSAAERLIAREVAAGADGYFEPIAGLDGFAEALRRLFRELDLGGFSAETFAAAAGDDVKLQALSRLYAALHERTSGFDTTARLLRDADASRFSGALFVYGVVEPPVLHARLIERIAELADVTVFLPDAPPPQDAAHRALRSRLEALGATTDTLAASSDAGATLARGLFGTAERAPDMNVTLSSAPDTVREVWECARTLLRWAEAGVRFHEMAVVYRNRDPYRALIDEIFRQAQIPAYVHDGRPLAAHPLGRRTLALLDLAGDGTFSRAKVMEFLTETRIPRETASRYDSVRPSEWETYTREAGIVAGADEWQRRLARLAAERRERARRENFEWLAETAARVEEFARFIADLHAALAARPDEASWAEHLAFLRDLAARYAAGVEPVLDALYDLAELDAVSPHVSFETFCRAVRDDLDTRDQSAVLGEPSRQFGREGVAVVDAVSLRHLRFRAVHLLGMAERAWPPPPRPDALLLEDERRTLNVAAPGAELPLRTEPDGEPLTLRLAAQAATEHLAVSYARSDTGGSGKHVPSYFFRAIAAARDGVRLPLPDSDWARRVVRIEAGRLATGDGAESLTASEYDRALVRGGGDEGAVAAIASLHAPFARAIAARQGRWSRDYSPHDGCLDAPDVVDAVRATSPFSGGRAVSPSRLEMYATCPYRYFLNYVLGITHVDEPEAIDRIDALERGSLIHAVLERFLRALGPGDPPRPEARERHIPLLLKVAEEEEREREERGVTGRPLLWQLDRRQIREDLVRWYDVEAAELVNGDLRPRAFEPSFGPITYGYGSGDDPLSTDEPVALDVDGRAVLVQGRIDRIDWDEARTRFRVIDYKTGKTKPKGSAVFDRGRLLQLPIYLRVAAKLLGIPAERGEAQYFYVTMGGGFERRTITGEGLAASEREFTQIVNAVADGIDCGYFAANPGKGRDNCRWCEYHDVCDARIDRIMERKRGPRAEAYLALAEIE